MPVLSAPQKLRSNANIKIIYKHCTIFRPKFPNKTEIISVAAIRTRRVLLLVLRTAARAIAALAGTALRLRPAFGLRNQHAVRQLELVGLGIDADDFHLDHIPLFQAGLLHRFETLVVDLRDVQQGVLARHDLDERTERHDRTNLAVIYIADLGLRHDALDAGQGCIHRLLVQTEDIHDALVVGFGDGNGRTRRLLNILDHLAAGTDHGTDHILRDGDLYDTRHERTVIRTRLGDTLRQLTQNVHTAHASLFQRLGPLPHSIINRPVEPEDAERFQSIFAKNEGAVTAPTASLHFSRELMKRLEIKGVDFAYITLHAGLGNFRDIDVEDLTKHKMDSEQMFVNEMAVKTVNRAKDNGRNVCAVGTTVMRAIESAVSTDGHLKEFEGWTNKFIFPPYEFTVANSMISNFHMPLSTLLMIVAAFGGYDQVMDAYHVALKEGYRFGTYGDAMLILDK